MFYWLMISLSASLEAHQKDAARRPYVRAVARPVRFGVDVFRWERYYAGTESDGPHALAVAGDGSLIRLRNDGGTLRLARVTAPGEGSDYSGWSAFGTAAAGTGVALAARSGGEVIAVYVTGSPPRTLTYRVSTDNGASWGSATTLVTESADIQWVAVAFRESNGDACVFYTQNPNVLKRLRRTSGSWAGAGTNWTNGTAVSALTGVSAAHNGADYIVAVTGATTTSRRRAWATRLIDTGGLTNLWGGLATVDDADSASTVEFRHPSILQAPQLDPHVWYAAVDSGPVAATRTLHVHPPHLSAGVASARWSFPEPHEAASAYGLRVAGDSGGTWAATPDGVWHAVHASQLDLSDRLIELTYTLGAQSATGRAVFDNADGGLTPLPGALVVGGQLELSPGYRSAADGSAEFGASVHLEVSRIEYGRSGRVEVGLTGAWELMGRRVAPTPIEVAAGVQSRAVTAEMLAARAGLYLTGTGGSAWVTHSPGFALAPPSTVGAALRGILAVAEEVVIPNGDGLRVRTPETSPDYAYGAGAHPIKWFTRVHAMPRGNWVRIQGPDRHDEVADFGSVYAHGGALVVERSADATSDAKAGDYAEGALEKVGRAVTGTLCVGVNAGAEVWDVVTVDDGRTGASGEAFRVVEVRLNYTRASGKAPVYEQVFALGDV